MHTPMGVFELKYFFNTGVGGKSGGESTPGEVIKMKLKSFIDKEYKVFTK
jgi:RNA polymerase sigma-54 factor